MNPIPAKLKRELLIEFSRCALCDSSQFELHHVWIYSGSQINEKGAILPGCIKHHPRNDRPGTLKYKDKMKWISINIMSLDYMQKKYPKFDWCAERKRLNKKYGEF